MKRKIGWLALGLGILITVNGCGSRDANVGSEDAVSESGNVSEKFNGDSGQVSTETTKEESKSSPSTNTDGIQEESSKLDMYIATDTEDALNFSRPETYGETYEAIEEEGFISSYSQPLSTFSVDVDTASYSNIRRYLDDNQLPPADAVKIEEMINYFDYDYDAPGDGLPFSVNTEVGPCPWNEDSNIAMIGLQGLEIERDERAKTNLVFLMDVSGSMDNPDKLPLLKEAFEMLTDQLGENDRVSIVVYAGASGVVLDGATGDDKRLIMERIRQLDAGGSTAGSEGIELAYDIAREHFVYNGNNRVILATDGDFNVGITDIDDLETFIEEKREEGIFLSVLGFGTGNTDFYTMETLADKGNGHFAYIDSAKEAEKVLVEELTGTLYTIAKDVKIQVEFNPNIVKSYRLIGYDNRRLADEDFDNDQVDAGDIGAGHRVTALYEIRFYGENTSELDLRYQDTEIKDIKNELMYVKLRYKEPQSSTSQLIEQPVNSVKLYDEVSDDFLFAASVAEFGLLLRQSEYRGDASFQHIYSALQASGTVFDDDNKFEFLQLVATAENLMGNYGYLE